MQMGNNVLWEMYIDDDLALKFSECVVKSKQIHATFHENWLETTRNRLAKVTNNWRILLDPYKSMKLPLSVVQNEPTVELGSKYKLSN